MKYKGKEIKNLENKTYITAMIDEPGQITTLGGIQNSMFSVDPEQVGGANTLFFIALFTDIRKDRSNHLSNILNHHFICTYILFGKETPIVNGGFTKGHILATELQRE